jgi:hypothetical protein|tara:strand:- start:1517 stop:1894 length:378 start_codon:yes stop_codon:yes gene_type:complete
MKTFKQHINEKDMTAISSWKRKLKNVKGLTKDQLQMLSQMPTPVLTSLINQVGMIVAQKEIEEAPLVMSDREILDSIWKEVKPKLEKELKRGNMETTNMIARLAKFKITKAGQSRGRSFRYDLKR